MDGLLKYDSKFWVILDRITDIVILNFLFIVASIPIVTIGASVSATYSVSFKHIKIFKSLKIYII